MYIPMQYRGKIVKAVETMLLDWNPELSGVVVWMLAVSW
jgi:type IV secretory pathway TrbD component